MSPLVLSRASAAQMRGLIKRRYLHESSKRQAIMMPAMSPLMTEGTITRWRIKEGDAFAPGDVLLEIESDFAKIDVEAHSPGILGKILLPDGTSNVPVEQVIALVVKDMSELAALQHLSTHSFSTIPAPPIRSINSPGQFMLPRTSARTPSLFEMQTMGCGFRGARVGGRCGAPRLDFFPKSVENDAPDHRVDVAPCCSSRIQKQDLHVDDQAQIDGAAIRRMIISKLQSASSMECFDELVH